MRCYFVLYCLPLALDGAPMLPPMDTPVGDDALLWLWYEGQINSDVLAARRLGSRTVSGVAP